MVTFSPLLILTEEVCLVFTDLCHKPPTDVVVLVSRPELEAQGEGREELELLREAQGSVGTAGTVALPALEAAHPVLAGSVALVVDHEEDVALHAPVGGRALVERTVDVQIVVDVHRHPVLSVPEPGKQTQQSVNVSQEYQGRGQGRGRGKATQGTKVNPVTRDQQPFLHIIPDLFLFRHPEFLFTV